MSENNLCPKCGAEMVSQSRGYTTYQCLAQYFKDRECNEGCDCLRRQLKNCLDSRDAERDEAHKAIAGLERQLAEARTEIASVTAEREAEQDRLFACLDELDPNKPSIPGTTVAEIIAERDRLREQADGLRRDHERALAAVDRTQRDIRSALDAIRYWLSEPQDEAAEAAQGEGEQ